MEDPCINTSASSASDVVAAELGGKRVYSSSVRLPVFGEVPLNFSEMMEDMRAGENAPLWAQFFKYMLCGLVSTVVLLVVYFGVRVFYGGYIADDLPSGVLKDHLGRVMLVAFVAANTVAYVTNRLYVFSPSGRHWMMEFLIFLAVAGASFYAGNVAKDGFIDAGLNKDVAALSFAVSSALVNFVARKYIVFSEVRRA